MRPPAPLANANVNAARALSEQDEMGFSVSCGILKSSKDGVVGEGKKGHADDSDECEHDIGDDARLVVILVAEPT